MKNQLRLGKRLLSGSLLAAALSLAGQASADWAAFNAQIGGPPTSPNATTWNPSGFPPGTGGPLTNIVTGAALPGVTLTLSGTPHTGNSTGADPAAGTPAYLTFHGFVNFVSSTNVNYRISSTETITYTFSGLDASRHYSLKASGIHGLTGGTYTQAWAQCEIVGAASSVNTHTAGCLTNGSPNATLTDQQVAINTGMNQFSTMGDMADWEEIVPDPSGTFQMVVSQYIGLLPDGSSADRAEGYTYGIGGIKLEEYAPPGPIVIATQPQSALVGLGDTAIFSVVLDTGTQPQYQWYKQDVGPIPNAVFPSLAITNASPPTNGTYYVVISNAGETVTSDMVSLTVTGAPMVIVTQPADQTVQVGDPATFVVEVTGTKPHLQWYKAGTPNVLISGATSPTYTITVTQTTNAGNYFVVASNFVNSVTSLVAVLTVTPHTKLPTVFSAVVQETGQTNTIVATFSEVMAFNTARVLSNYSIAVASTPNTVTISNINAFSNTVSLRVGGANWIIGGDYVLTVNGVSGLYSNYIAPNSQVAVSFFQNLVPAGQSWKYSEITSDQGTAWQENGYDDSLWSSGTAAFYLGQISACAPTNTPLQDAQTYYYRTHFNAPATTGRATLTSRQLIDDGAIFYLNGLQIFSYNMPAGIPITYQTPASSPIGIPVCITNTILVANVLSGDNVLAVEVHQANPTGSDAAFDLEWRGAVTATLVQRPHLNYSYQGGNTIHFSWQGSGLTLESRPAVQGGIWSPVATASPYDATISDQQPLLFFRLHGQ